MRSGIFEWEKRKFYSGREQKRKYRQKCKSNPEEFQSRQYV